LDRSGIEPEASTVPARERPGAQVVVGLLGVIAAILIAAALKASAPVTMPLAFAYFLAVLVYPMQVWLGDRLPERLHGLAVVLTMLAVLGVLALAIGLLVFALQLVVSGAPEHLDQLESRLGALRDWARNHGIDFQDLGLDGERIREFGERLLSGLTSVATISAFATVLDAVGSIGVKVRKYLLIRTLAGLISGLWLWLLGVEFAVLWGLLFFLLNYVPNIGSLVAGIPPALLAFLQLGLGWALVAVAGLVLIDQVIGNYLDPRLMGRTLNMSSLVVLISVVLWGWIWGVVGTLLAVPMTVAIMSACERVPALRPIAILLQGGEDDGEPDPA
jgi:predicted PurR-regulated permease PerM